MLKVNVTCRFILCSKDCMSEQLPGRDCLLTEMLHLHFTAVNERHVTVLRVTVYIHVWGVRG